jgi:hypothetical protein
MDFFAKLNPNTEQSQKLATSGSNSTANIIPFPDILWHLLV